jgi:hypothetical protein
VSREKSLRKWVGDIITPAVFEHSALQLACAGQCNRTTGLATLSPEFDEEIQTFVSGGPLNRLLSEKTGGICDTALEQLDYSHGNKAGGVLIDVEKSRLWSVSALD